MKINTDKQSHIPIYIQIKEEMEKYIKDNSLEEGDVLPTLSTIAESSSVSLRTAQKAVQEMIADGTCSQSSSRRLIVGRKPMTVTVAKPRDVFIICDHEGRDTFYDDYVTMHIMSGIRKEINAMEDKEVVFAGKQFEQSLDFYLANPCMNIRGVIMLHWQDRESMVKLALDYPQVKFVHVNYVLPDLEELPENVYGIFNDDFAGAYQATEYLLSKGCRNPVFLEIQIKDETYRARREGFLAALRDNEISGRVYMQKDPNGTLDERVAMHYRFFAEVVRATPNVDGVLTCYDPMAEAVRIFINDHERYNKLGLLSYDGYIETRSSSLNTISVRYAEMGRKAVKLLDSPENKPRFQRILPQLIIKKRNRNKLDIKKLSQEKEPALAELIT